MIIFSAFLKSHLYEAARSFRKTLAQNGGKGIS